MNAQRLDEKITIVMISMNEEEAIRYVLTNIIDNVPNSEIILVDSSTDQTPNIAANFKNVRIIRQFPPIGYGPAMTLALRSASRDYIVTLDCDNTYPCNAILPMVELLDSNKLDLVDGSRLRVKPKNMPLLNYIGNVCFGFIASLFFLRLFKL